jgi:hypothetical protein
VGRSRPGRGVDAARPTARPTARLGGENSLHIFKARLRGTAPPAAGLGAGPGRADRNLRQTRRSLGSLGQKGQSGRSDCPADSTKAAAASADRLARPPRPFTCVWAAWSRSCVTTNRAPRWLRSPKAAEENQDLQARRPVLLPRITEPRRVPGLTGDPNVAASSQRAGQQESLDRRGSEATVAKWTEVHRLAVAGQVPAIARDVGTRIGQAWLPRSRFADAAAVASATLTLGPDASAFYGLGHAQSFTGQPWQALASY